MKPDAKIHLKGGTVVLVAALLISLALLALGCSPLTVALFVAGLVAGASVEGTQANDNRNAKQQGLAAPHEVSWRDLLNSALPCWLACAAIELLVRSQAVSLPGWLL